VVTLYSFDSSTKLVGLNDTETPDNIPDTLVDAQTETSPHQAASERLANTLSTKSKRILTDLILTLADRQ